VKAGFLVASLLALVLGGLAPGLGCTGESGSPAVQKAEEEKTASISLSEAKDACPVTHPNGNGPPGERPSKTYHGNDVLWTVLSRNGVIVAGPDFVRPDGSIRWKFPWWAEVGNLAGDLTIRGRNLHAAAPPLRPRINRGSPESGFSGSDFWASEIVFPSEGCWEVTGEVRYTQASLTFTTFVVKG
jgi:hypothetical protein